MKKLLLQATVVNLALVALLLPERGYAATLRSETVTAWEEYLQTVDAKLQNQVQPGTPFLWTFESPERAAKVHGGEIVIAPASGQNPRKVPGGLIHHWIGAAFLPGVKINDILDVTRDYDRYKSFFSPTVIDSKVISLDSSADRFSMLLMNRAFFLKTALDADYESSIVRVDDCRVYITSRSTRVQEIEEYGHSGAHKIPEGEGSGYIWKMHGVSRMEQRDGGVYVELEALALSREIPAAIRFVADPIVRRVSRNSLLVSLQQTGDAVRSHVALMTRPTALPANTNQVHSGMQLGFSNKGSVSTDIH